MSEYIAMVNDRIIIKTFEEIEMKEVEIVPPTTTVRYEFAK